MLGGHFGVDDDRERRQNHPAAFSGVPVAPFVA
jgi:hypothetical protein